MSTLHDAHRAIHAALDTLLADAVESEDFLDTLEPIALGTLLAREGERGEGTGPVSDLADALAAYIGALLQAGREAGPDEVLRIRALL